MPAKSKKQRQLMAIAEHHPEMISEKNKGVLSMTHQQMHDYATTSEKNLPEKKKHHSAEDGDFLTKRKKMFGV